MRFSDRSPMEVPAPPTVDDVAAQLPVALMGLVPQPSLTELGAGLVGSSTDGAPTILDQASISYTVWRNPGDKDDPINLAELSDDQRRSLAIPPVRPLPEWLQERRRLAVYPAIWEAVTTFRARGYDWETPESHLVGHANHILTNTFREERVVGEFPGELAAPVTLEQVEPAMVIVDGAETRGLTIDTDPDVFAAGAFLGDSTVVAVIPREFLPYVTVEFATRR